MTTKSKIQAKIIVLVPSRDRDTKHIELIQAYTATTDTINSQLVFGLDSDNYTEYNQEVAKNSAPNHIFYDVNERVRMLPTLNLLAKKYASKADIIGFWGDDHRPRTNHWEKLVIKAFEDLGGTGIVYGDDLLQGENLPTAVFISSDIIKTLGFMTPHDLIHLYADNFWKDLGQSLGKIKYLPELIIEHMHYSNGKSEQDAMYTEVNSSEMYKKDEETYLEYKKDQLEKDVDKLKKSLKI